MGRTRIANEIGLRLVNAARRAAARRNIDFITRFPTPDNFAQKWALSTACT